MNLQLKTFFIKKYKTIIAIIVISITLFNLHISTKATAEQPIDYVVVEKEVIVEVEPTYEYNITQEEREMLARIVHRESNIESIECQMAVASVIINRWINGYWGNSLHDVIYAKNQFTPAGLIYKTTPTETNYNAVDYVLKNGVTIPNYVMFFRADYHFNWDGYVPYSNIDHTYFGYLEKDKK